MLKTHLASLPGIKPYILVYNEAVICNLLDIMLFNKTAVEACEDAIIELIDYVYRKLLRLMQM